MLGLAVAGVVVFYRRRTPRIGGAASSAAVALTTGSCWARVWRHATFTHQQTPLSGSEASQRRCHETEDEGKPRPPIYGGRLTLGHEVDSSAIGKTPRPLEADQHIHRPHEVDGLEVLPAAVLVGNSLAIAATVIEIQHARNRVHPQTVHVIHSQPEHCVRQQETADFVATVVRHLRAPIGMLILARVGMLV